MHATVSEIVARCAGDGPVDRRQLLERVALYGLSDSSDTADLVTVLRAVGTAAPRLEGPRVSLSRDDLANVASAVAQRPTPRKRSTLMCVFLALDICGAGFDEAFRNSIGTLLRNPDDEQAIFQFSDMLAAAGVMVPTDARWRAGCLNHLLAAARTDKNAITRVLLLMGLERGRSIELRTEILSDTVVPIMGVYRDLGLTGPALDLESIVYRALINTVEQPAHHAAVFSLLAPFLSALGRWEGGRSAAPQRRAPQKRPRVAFFIVSGFHLAHAATLLALLAGLKKAGDDAPIEPFVCAMYPEGVEGLQAACAALNVEMIVVPASHKESGHAAWCQHCRAAFTSREIDAVVFVSMAIHLEFLSTFRLAPVSIWMCMKFPLPSFAALDGRVFFARLVPVRHLIEGATWHGGPIAVPPIPTADSRAIADVRARFPGGPLLGAVAREHKIMEPEFLRCVVEILRRHPTAQFVWTGRERLPEIERAFRDGGVAGRCYYIGWVDPGAYIPAFDIFLETFPLTGVTSAWAMSCGVPVVSTGASSWYGLRLDPQTSGIDEAPGDVRRRVAAIFDPVVRRLPCIWGRTAGDFVALADALLRDESLRRDFGRAGRAFHEAFLCDEVGAAVAQASQIRDIIVGQ